MRHEDVAMEYYIAEAMRPLERCLEDVEACDLYVLLLAFRYGSIPEGHQHSYTELEFRHALDLKKPMLVFILDPNANWPPARIEFSAIQKVEAFRQLAQTQLSTTFTTEEDLATALVHSVRRWEMNAGFESGPRTDWDSYRAAVAAKHRWVRLAVIAGASQDRRAAHIPLTDVFVPQRTAAGRPAFDIPAETWPGETDAVGDAQGSTALANGLEDAPGKWEPDDEAAIKADGDPLSDVEALQSAVQESSLAVLGREPKQVFLGGPGSGKSTLFHYAMLAVCEPTIDEAEIPLGLTHRPCAFLIELRQYTLRGASGFVDYLVQNARDYYGVEIEAEDIKRLLSEEGGGLVLFDGLDEILKPADRARIIDQFEAFARQYPRASIVVSTRIAGYEPERLQLSSFAHYTLLNFGLTEIRRFVPLWYRYYTWEGDERHAAGLVARIVESPRLLELGGNPLMLTMMAVIYKNQDLPAKRWQLYERCAQVLLDDWDVKRKNIERNELLPLDFPMDVAQKAALLGAVSMQMLLGSEPGRQANAIDRRSLSAIFATYIEETYQKVPVVAKSIGEEILNHIRERTFILAEIGEDTYGFVHRTFMEYFAALQIRGEFNSRKADYTWLRDEVVLARWHRDEWREILFLLLAMIKDQNSPIDEVVDLLLRQKSGASIPPRNIEFAARCLAEAGAADGPLVQEVVAKLTRSVLRWASRTSKPEVDRYVADALIAFTMLAPTIADPHDIRQLVEQATIKTRRDRMIVWQMELALLSRDERMQFALAGSSDKEEAVRLGAIATLEREWPGRENVGPVVLEMARADRNSRVREAAVQALSRSWPHQPGTLEMLFERAADETAYSHVLWLAEYVANNWKAHSLALPTLLELAATKHKASESYDYAAVETGVARAIVRAWGGSPEVADLLRSEFVNADPHVRHVITLALASWGHDPSLLAWVEQRVEIVEPSVRRVLLETIGEQWAGTPDGLAALQRLGQSSLEDARSSALSAIATHWHGQPEVLDWLVERESVEESALVRERIPSAIASVAPPDRVETLLLEIAESDPSPGPKVEALLLLAGASRHMIISSADFEDDYGFGWRWHFDYLPEGRSRVPRRDDSRAVIATFERLSTSASDPLVQQAAVLALARSLPEDSVIPPAILHLLSDSGHREVRAQALLAVEDILADEYGLLFAGAVRAALGAGKSWGYIRFHFSQLPPPSAPDRRKRLDEDTEAVLLGVASNDVEVGMRTAATVLLFKRLPRSTGQRLLRARISHENDRRAVEWLHFLEASLGNSSRGSGRNE